MRDITAGVPTDYLRSLFTDEALVRGGAEFYLADALGSALELTDNTGAIATEYTYEPFGTTAVTGTTTTNSFDFSAREDDGIGLKYYRFRYYHPGLQRFITEDPAGFVQGEVNLYTYALNSPANFDDPLGLDALADLPNFSAGFGDTITLGGTAFIRNLWIREFGLPDVVRASSAWNMAGRKAGYAWEILSMVAGGAAAFQGVRNAVSELERASALAFKAADAVQGFKVPLKHLARAAGGYTKFAEGVDAHEAIAEALRSANATFRPNNVAGAFRVVTDLGRIVGTKGETSIRVVVGYTGKIWTAFPVR